MSPKELRKQLRNVAQELGKELINDELFLAVEKRIKAHVDDRLNRIEAYLTESLKKIDQRSQDMQSYIVRESVKNQKVSGV